MHTNLGTYHLENTKDYGKALQYFMKAAEKGSAGSVYQVGSIYQKGQSVEKDMKQACHWYEKAPTWVTQIAKKFLAVLLTVGLETIPKTFNWLLNGGKKHFCKGTI